MKTEWIKFTNSYVRSRSAAKFGVFFIFAGTTLLLPAQAQGAMASDVKVICANTAGEQRTFITGWDNSNSFFQGKGQISRLYCEGGFAGAGLYRTFLMNNLQDASLDYYNGIAPVVVPPVVDSPTVIVAPNPETTTVVVPDTQTPTVDSPTVILVPETPTLVTDSPTVISAPPVVDTPTLVVPVETSTSISEPTPTPQPVPSIQEPSPTPEPIAPAPVVVEPTPVVVPQEPAPQPPAPEPTPPVAPEPAPVEPPAPIEPPPAPVEPAPEPPVPVDPAPTPEEPAPIPVEPPPAPEEPAPIPVEPAPTPVEPPVEPPVVDPVPAPPIEEPSLLSPDPVSILDVDVATLPPDTPVELENGVILTAEVVVALQLLENPAELLSAIFTDPTQVFTALSNIGADMSPEVREKSEKVVISAIIAGGIATQAASLAASSTYRRKP